MAVDLNFHKVIRFFLSIIFFTFLWSNGFSANLNFEKIAELKNISIDEVAKTTTETACKLFKKLTN